MRLEFSFVQVYPASSYMRDIHPSQSRVGSWARSGPIATRVVVRRRQSLGTAEGTTGIDVIHCRRAADVAVQPIDAQTVDG